MTYLTIPAELRMQVDWRVSTALSTKQRMAAEDIASAALHSVVKTECAGSGQLGASDLSIVAGHVQSAVAAGVCGMGFAPDIATPIIRLWVQEVK